MASRIDQDTVRLSPGRYRVHREFACDGEMQKLEIECNNPAWGSAWIDEVQLTMLEASRPMVKRA